MQCNTIFFKVIIQNRSLSTPREIALKGEYHRTLPMRSQHWFRLWLGAIRHQAITWTDVDIDICRHMASLGHNESIYTLPYKEILLVDKSIQWLLMPWICMVADAALLTSLDLHQPKYNCKIFGSLSSMGNFSATYDISVVEKWYEIVIHIYLTYWGGDGMDNISQVTFANEFSSMKMFQFWLAFHWSLFLRV